jgi:hypothetical protein
MTKKMTTKKKVIVTILILIPFLMLGYYALASRAAKEKAAAICNDIKWGYDVAQIREVMTKAGIPELSAHPSLMELVRKPHYSFPRPDIVVASIPAAFWERWVCGARLKDGKVINTEIRPVN